MSFVSFDELIVVNAIVNCHYSNNYSISSSDFDQ